MIEFFNIRTGERRRVTTEPMLAAFYNSTDQGPNSHGGQDFGWRIAPETIKRIREIQSDRALMDHIKSQYQLLDEPKDTDILRWISAEEARKQTESGKEAEGDFTRQYEDDVRALDDRPKPVAAPVPEEDTVGNEVPDEIDVAPEDTYPLNKPIEKPKSSKK